MAETLGLSVGQKDAMRKMLLEDEDRRRDLTDRVARGEIDWADSAAREELRGYADSRQQRIQGLLTPEQFEQYQKTPEANMVRFFGGGGPGGDLGFGRFFGDRRPRPGRDRADSPPQEGAGTTPR